MTEESVLSAPSQDQEEPEVRKLKLALVLDDATSMILWQETIEELHRTIARVPLLDDIRVWQLNTARPDRPTLVAHPLIGLTAPRPAAGDLSFPDPTRVVLIASDCIAPAWDTAELPRTITTWAQRQPVALVQLLPQHLWRRTALDPDGGVRNGHVGTAQAGVPNALLSWQAWRPRPVFSTPQPAAAASRRTAPEVPIPVLTPNMESLTQWVNLVYQGGPPTLPAVIFPAQPPRIRRHPTRMGTRRHTPRDAINSFRGISSAFAYKLAQLLAAAPLRLPVMRHVQRALLPGSGEVHLAEFFLSGLIVRAGPTGSDPNLIDYDFLPGVRELLLDSGVVHEALNVQREVHRYLAPFGGHSFDIDALLALRGNFDWGQLSAMTPAFARVSAEVLKRLGGSFETAVSHLLRGAQEEIPTSLPPAGPAG
jgi:hypothetical protein